MAAENLRLSRAAMATVTGMATDNWLLTELELLAEPEGRLLHFERRPERGPTEVLSLEIYDRTPPPPAPGFGVSP